MKKMIALLMCLILLLSLAACSQERKVDEDEQKDGTVQKDEPGKDDVAGPGDEDDEQPTITDEISVENLMVYPESPEGDFEVMGLGDGTCQITKYLGDDEIVVIPASIGGSKPVELSSYLFRNTPTVKAIRLCDPIETIGYATFSFNENIEIIVFGSGVRELGEAAFMHAKGIREVVLNEGLETIGPNCFQSCTVQRLEIPGTVTEIGAMAFAGCDVQEVVLGEGITQLSDGTFFGCDQLGSLVLPDTLSRINGGAFSMCSALSSVVIPQGVKEIEDGAFQECGALTEVTLPEGLERIGDGGFNSCTSLTGIDIPDSVTSIGEDAFKGCTGLLSVDIPDSVTEIGEEAFYNCETIIGGSGSYAQRYAVKNGIAFQDRGTGSVIGGEGGYVAALPEDLILAVNGIETSLIGKGGIEIMDALGLGYELSSGVYDPTVPQYITYDGNGDGWWDIIVDEARTDSGNSIYVERVTVKMEEGITILGMTSGATIYEAFSILGEPDEKDSYNRVYTYYWDDVQIGETVIDRISIDTFDDTFHELTIRFYPPVEG